MAGARLIGISFFFYWGFTSFSGRLTPTESWMIAAAGPAVTLVLGWLGLAIGLAGPFRPAFNLLIAQFGVVQLFQILVFYPLLTLANFGDLAGSDFAVLYGPATPALGILTAIVHGGSALLLVAGYRIPAVRDRYRRVTAGGSSGDIDSYPAPGSGQTKGSIYAAVLAAPEGTVPELPDDRLDSLAPPEPPPAGAIASALETLAATPSPEARSEVERLLALDEDGRRLNEVVGQLVEKQLDFGVLYGEMRGLAFGSNRRGPVKYGLAFTGLFSRPANERLFLTMARHPAFTRVYAV
jgi:hypothetical protein